jgi:hypothetical protein
MIHLIKGILTKEECEFLSKQFDIEKINNFSSDIKADTNESFGFRPSHNFNKYLEILKPRIFEFNKEVTHIENINTYVREYYNDAFLVKHIDRKDISVTMSICLESTIDTEWPLFAKIDGKEYSFNTNVGDGILLFGADKNIHWRNTLNCKENQRVLQFFLHWSPSNFLIKNTKSLI